jgi:hypothetical protein
MKRERQIEYSLHPCEYILRVLLDHHFDQRNISYILQNIYHWKLQKLYFLMV